MGLLHVLILLTLGALLPPAGAEDFKYNECSLDIKEAYTALGRWANGEPQIYASVICGGVVVYEETKTVSKIRSYKVEGTPITLFHQVKDDYYAIVLIDNYQKEEPFVVKDSEFIQLPSLDSSDTYDSPPRAPLVIQDSNVVVRNVTFVENTGFQAGAIYLQLSSAGEAVRDTLVVDIIDSNFTSNQGDTGGAIVVDGFPFVVVEACEFTVNSPNAVTYIGTVEEKLFILGSFFVGTKEGDSGKYAGVTGDGPGLLYVEDTSFKGHYRQTGGAISWKNTKSGDVAGVAVLRSAFEGNTAAVSGGAIYAGQQVVLAVRGSQFEGNEAVFGGAIQLLGAIMADISHTEFSANKGNSKGGAIMQNTPNVDLGYIVLTNVQFYDNQSPAGVGGACSIEGGNLTMSSCSLWRNTAMKAGGALFAGASNSLQINDTTFESNSAAQASGGAISAGAMNAGLVKSLTISNSTFTNNTAAKPCDVSSRNLGGGAIIFVGTTDSILSIETSSFTANHGIRGGAIYTSSVSKITVEDSSFEQNLADRGAAMNVDTVRDLIFKRSSAKDCRACTWDGGAIYAKGDGTGQLIVDHSKFSGNSAPVDDGGAAKLEKFKTAQILSSDFSSNTASDTGGSLYLKYLGSLHITNSHFTKGNATAGGCLMINNVKDPLKITDSTFSQCTAVKNGGALSAMSISSSLSIESSSFAGNSIDKARGVGGGAVTLDGVEAVSMHGTTMKGNSGKNGGALSITNSKSIELDSCSISDNRATMGGGAYIAHLGLLNITNSDIQSNAAYEGGNLYLENSTDPVISHQTKFLKGVADNNGGALVAKSIAAVVLTNSTASNNQAKGGSGGALYMESVGKIEISGTKLSQNVAKLQGGGSYVVNPTSSVSFAHCSIDESKSGNGAGLWIGGGTVDAKTLLNAENSSSVGSSLVVESTSFNSNAASGNGGAMSVENMKSMSLTSLDFDKNEADQGAGAFLKEVEQVQIENVTIDNAKSITAGGALFLGSGGNITATNLLIDNNAAQGGGGIMCKAGAHVEIKDSDFYGNKAKTGSTILAECGCYLTLFNSTLEVIKNGIAPVSNDANCSDVHLVNCTILGIDKKGAGGPSIVWIILALILLQMIGLAIICCKLMPALFRQPDVDEENAKDALVKDDSESSLTIPLIVTGTA